MFFLSCFIMGLSLHAGKPVQTSVAPAEEFCTIRNTSFGNGEQLSFVVYYSIIGIYVNAGNATVVTSLERMNNRPVYHITGFGKSNSSYSWIAKVNNRYETFVDTSTLQPMKFVRDVHEGNHKKYEHVSFNRNTRTAVSNDGVFKVPTCVQDVVSSLYYARNIDFSKYKPGEKISFSMFLDGEVYNMYLRYMGKEEIKTRYGKFRALKLRPLLLKGNVFEGGEDMNVWVSDDANHIPLRVESPISVGSVKVDMMGYKNLRHPLTSLKKLR
jgi:hypothetical protein